MAFKNSGLLCFGRYAKNVQECGARFLGSNIGNTKKRVRAGGSNSRIKKKVRLINHTARMKLPGSNLGVMIARLALK